MVTMIAMTPPLTPLRNLNLKDSQQTIDTTTLGTVMTTLVLRRILHREKQTILVMIVIIKTMSPLSQPPLLPALLQPALLEIRSSKIKLATLQSQLSLRSPTYLLSPRLRLSNVVRFYLRHLHLIPLPA
jgi:hypothetical protein